MACGCQVQAKKDSRQRFAISQRPTTSSGRGIVELSKSYDFHHHHGYGRIRRVHRQATRTADDRDYDLHQYSYGLGLAGLLVHHTPEFQTLFVGKAKNSRSGDSLVHCYMYFA